MTNNDVLRSVRYMLDLSDSKVVEILRWRAVKYRLKMCRRG